MARARNKGSKIGELRTCESQTCASQTGDSGKKLGDLEIQRRVDEIFSKDGYRPLWDLRDGLLAKEWDEVSDESIRTSKGALWLLMKKFPSTKRPLVIPRIDGVIELVFIHKKRRHYALEYHGKVDGWASVVYEAARDTSPDAEVMKTMKLWLSNKKMNKRIQRFFA